MTADTGFQPVAWHEPLVTELGSPGERGMLVPGFDGQVGPALPEGLRRTAPPNLP